MKVNKFLKHDLGFTLVELLIGMTIVAVLTALSLVSYQGARKNARDGERKADLEQVRSALEICRADTGSYPLGALSSGDDISCGGTTYLTIPLDPIDSFNYVYSGTASTYILCATLEVSGSTVVGCGSCGSSDCNYKLVNP